MAMSTAFAGFAKRYSAKYIQTGRWAERGSDFLSLDETRGDTTCDEWFQCGTPTHSACPRMITVVRWCGQLVSRCIRLHLTALLGLTELQSVPTAVQSGLCWRPFAGAGRFALTW